MIKYIIFLSDIHIRNYKRLDEYKKQLKKFVDECKAFVDKHGAEHVRIVIAGDLLHNKLDISGEGYVIASQFLKALDELCITYVISGNHDMNMANLSRIDPLSAIFSMCDFKQTYFLDSELEYKSGYIIDKNITWCLYSSFDSFAKPNISEAKISNPDNLCIGLFHGEIKSAKTDAGFVSENGINVSHFSDLDFVICGHIHKRQKLTYNDTTLVYPGSLIQQDHGENITNHGYCILNCDTLEYTEHNIDNESAFYTFSINSIEDIDNNTEQLLNY
jgi:DNA repair exonuclease SbcCD nuclease subunit